MNYYNEFDPLKAEVLREAIKAGAIAPGDVDERSISDVRAADLAGYTQCHFFAGGGFWSLALRYAGWPDDKPVWTGSCPCPSFSAAGKGGGFDDPRHLWPDWARLIRECRPATIFGEQADAAVGYGWVDLVQTDLEAAAYAFGKVVFGAHSVGAPHIRQRLYFCADTEHYGCHRPGRTSTIAHSDQQDERIPDGDFPAGIMPHPDGGQPSNGDLQRSGEHGLFAQDRGTGDAADSERDGGRPNLTRGSEEGRAADGRNCSTGDGSDTPQRGLPMRGRSQGDSGHLALANEAGSGPGVEIDAIRERLQGHFGHVREWRGPGWLDPQQARSIAETGATRGFWADCDWWHGRDGKYRPIGSARSSLLTMADGSSESLGPVRDRSIEELEKEVMKHGKSHQIDPREALFDLWMSYAEKTVDRRDGGIGRRDGVWQAPILFAFLRQLKIQGWSLAEGISGESAQDAREMVRGVRREANTVCPSCERDMDRQPAGECANALHLLSQILALAAHQAWGQMFNEDALGISPLATGSPARVGRLRLFGDAIVTTQATEFIKAYLEARGE